MRQTRSHNAGIVLFFLLTGQAAAQIPNAGFENWTNGTPNGWFANNVPFVYTTITSSTIAHSGNLAARGAVVSSLSIAVPPLLQSGSNLRGFPFSQRPTSFTGYYQFSPVPDSGDIFGISAQLFKGGVSGTLVASAPWFFSASASSYTQFTVPFLYATSDSPDTCVIQFLIAGGSTGTNASPHVGSYFLVDDIAFEGTSGVNEKTHAIPAVFRLDQNYPNPFNPTTNISFTVPANGSARLFVFNLLGQEVVSLFDGSVITGRLYRLTFNGSPYPSGVYFSKLEYAPDGTHGVGAQMLMRKMVLMK